MYTHVMLPNTMEQDELYIYGKHAVLEALSASRHTLIKVLISPTRKDEELFAKVRKAGITIMPLDPNRTPRGMDEDAVHQGVVGVIAAARLMVPYKKFIEALAVTPHTALVLLGEVQDPHNVGAIIRSAAAFGVAGVLIPEHNQAQVTGAVIKVSAGMSFKVPLVAVGNVNTTARDLKEKGFWVYGLDGDAPLSVNEEVYSKPSVFILGNEGRGLRQKTQEVCDVLLSIPMHPRCESLNVSVSAAVTLAAWSREHTEALES